MGRDKNSLGRALVKDRFGANKGKRKVDHGSMLHTTEVQDGYDWGRLNLQSVTEESSFQEFLSTAQLAGTEFQAEKLNLKLVSIGGIEAVTSKEARAKAEKKNAESKHLLRVPRRPQWNKDMTAEQVTENEKQSFLDWRRDLALLQEKDGMIMTPYEKNLEFWRQLWRVLERSHLLVQVLDARNPLLFRCEDLESYAKEIGVKSLMLLLNKADLLTQRQREMWAEYFDKQGVKIAFFSAVLATEQIKLERKKRMEETEQEVEISEEETDESCNEDNAEDIEDSNDIPDLPVLSTMEDILDGIDKLNMAVDKTAQKIKNFQDKLTSLAKMESAAHIVKTDSTEGVSNQSENRNSENSIQNSSPLEDGKENKESCKIEKNVRFDENLREEENISDETSSASQVEEVSSSQNNCDSSNEKNDANILTREQLLELFAQIGKNHRITSGRFTIGMVGYPNVGKSSTINALMMVKKVSVSATPGKTKHFQTLMLSDSLMLCDCPGLVLPSFVCTKADMVVHGILPIDQMREYMEAITILSECIGGRKAAERKLGILLPPPPSDRPDYLPPRDLLLAYAYSRGMMNGAGSPDCARAARVLLRAACLGKLSVAIAPPGVDVEEFREELDLEANDVQIREMTPQEKRALKSGDTADDVDNAFFKGPGLAAHAKGVQGKFSGLPKVRVRTVNGTPLHETELTGKPWKYFNKHNNKKKREKLRRVYGHLDQH